MSLRSFLAVGFSVLLVAPSSFADEPGEALARSEHSAVIAAPVDAVWQHFTTAEGLKKWMAPVIDVDFRVGGKIRSSYNPRGTLGDENTIENTILAFDPERMIALKNTRSPKGFPFAKAAETSWSVFYFEPVGETKTKFTLVAIGLRDDEESKRMRAYFEKANAGLVEKLKGIIEGDGE